MEIISPHHDQYRASPSSTTAHAVDRGPQFDMTNLAHVKLALLCEGIAFDASATTDIGTAFAETRPVYNYGHLRLDAGVHAVPVEILLANRHVTAVRYRPHSPWRVGVAPDGRFALRHHDEVVCDVQIPQRPRYYGTELANGVKTDEVVTQFSVYALGIFVRRGCYFWDIKEPCKFCSIESTRKRFREFHDQLNTDNIMSAAMKAIELDDRIRYIEWCSGTYEDLDAGFLDIAQTAQELAPLLPSYIKQHAIVMPPKNLELIKLLDVMDQPTFAMEIWDPDYFIEVVPGKHNYYGRDGFLNALCKGVEVLGHGQITCNFVGGLEPVEGLIQGFNELADMGIVPTVAIFHPDRGTPYASKSPPAVKDMMKMARGLAQVYRREGFRPSLLGSRRASVDCEVYHGYFED